MKLYQFDPAPASHRVKIFLRETGIKVPIVQLNVPEGAQFAAPFDMMNTFNCTPFLDLGDGVVISESISICRYLEEIMCREILLFGKDAKIRAIIDMWNRRLEIDAYIPMITAIRNKLPNFARKVMPGTRNNIKQIPEIVERGKQAGVILFARLNNQLIQTDFIAGDEFSIADITGSLLVNQAKILEIDLVEFPNIQLWKSKLEKRKAFQL